jgi:DNA-binding HxlR family transcriptional regulator
MAKKEQHNPDSCKSVLRPVRDALDVVNGKWKLPIIIALSFGPKRFTEIAKEVEGITDRMLSRELKDLELNGLIERNIEESYPVKVTYSLTTYSKSLNQIIESLRIWGVKHRAKIRQSMSKV